MWDIELVLFSQNACSRRTVGAMAWQYCRIRPIGRYSLLMEHYGGKAGRIVARSRTETTLTFTPGVPGSAPGNSNSPPINIELVVGGLLSLSSEIPLGRMYVFK